MMSWQSLDQRNLNNTIKREHFKLPTIEDIAAKFAAAKVNSTLDVSTGFWQKRLNETVHRCPNLIQHLADTNILY